jgi:hypothetical protein
MKSNEVTGLYLFSKSTSTDTALKPMLQYLRSHSPGKNLQFAYVESETSLLPHLSLWENLHVVVGGSNWKEFTAQLEVDWQPLINLIRNPDVKAAEATAWEKLTTSLLKATLIQSHNIIIDINEAHHTTFNLMNFKKILLSLSEKKDVYLATATPEAWMDSAHTIIKRVEFEFVVEDLRTSPKKSKQTA